MMSELRYNLISREWVIIATERAKRPEDFSQKKKERLALPEYKDTCPFCPGNEHLTPSETFRIPGQGGWKVRATFNKFAAVSPQQELYRESQGVFHAMSGYGFHEVIIEHPAHNAHIPLLGDSHVEDIIKTYKDRYEALSKNKGIEMVVIFKNHGVQAGTSLEHTHAQVIATAIVPPQIRRRVEHSIRYFDNTGRCVFCQTLQEELSSKDRIIVASEHFVAFIPYAALSPFHIWIFPRRHASSFVEISAAEISDLAKVLKTVLGKLHVALDDPDYNLTVNSIPVRENENEYYHWYMSIIPRVSQMAGFELGSGMFINVALPEQSAEFLRNARVSPR